MESLTGLTGSVRQRDCRNREIVVDIRRAPPLTAAGPFLCQASAALTIALARAGSIWPA